MSIYANVKTKIPAYRRDLSFHAFFQCGCAERGQKDPFHAIFCRQYEGFWQIVAGNHLSLLFRPVQKFPGALGGGGVVQVEDADDALLPDGHVTADVQVHNNPPIA